MLSWGVLLLLLKITGAVYWDAVGSIAVSALLGVVAITLIQRNRKWLIGKSMPKVRLMMHRPLCELLGLFVLAHRGRPKRPAAASPLHGHTCT